MTTQTAPALSELYAADETAWYDAMVELIDLGRHDALDLPNLREHLADMGASARHEVESRLVVLVAHVLKWTHQPNRRSRSWHLTVLEQQRELRRRAPAGALRRHAEEAVADEYPDAVKAAAVETGLPEATFPAACPYTLDQLLAFDPTAV